VHLPHPVNIAAFEQKLFFCSRHAEGLSQSAVPIHKILFQARNLNLKPVKHIS
jgi:hypothetical protein